MQDCSYLHHHGSHYHSTRDFHHLASPMALVGVFDDVCQPLPSLNIEDLRVLEPVPIQPESIRIVDRVSIQDSGLCNIDRDASLLLELLRNVEESPLCQMPPKRKQCATHSDQDRSANHGSPSLSSFKDDHSDWQLATHQPLFQRPTHTSSLIGDDAVNDMTDPSMDSSPRSPTFLARTFESLPLKCTSSTKNTGHGRTATTDTHQQNAIIKPHHARRWNQKLQDLQQYYRQHGTYVIADTNGTNRGLAQWVKRQRYQYRLKVEGKASTMTNARVAALNKLGFCWNPRPTLWDERYSELLAFHRANGHCNIPIRYSLNPSLAVWAKCQRRQMKLLDRGTCSFITEERQTKLLSIGFDWNPRNLKS